ncbi:hypothetical protein PIB30_039310 [Stylosanthes scabra]|uniref:tRNA(Ile)-lysidine synthetase n=1 Tax=Stylosanthes scabra TaxID=79078 RepID=A0ABU6QFQ8_9FABA|nr:hypothetical protein [Stylosanthes scabra]
MARGVILSTPSLTATTCSLLASFSKTPRKGFKLSLSSHLLHHHQPCSLPIISCSFSVSSSAAQCSIDLSNHREVFSSRMAMAGLKPHHSIALGVSGGPDSMALCVLTAGWKTAGANAVNTDSGGFIDGLLAIIVDHGLRAESKEEANIVCRRVSKMGIRCKIATCDWSSGKPKQGQLQEAARDIRYQSFQKVCAENQIGVLLVAHHADDQAELFILRLSRNSGVLGLAGMPFTSHIFPMRTHSCDRVQPNCGILLVRPLLEFSKEDMYKICQGVSENWVEDPTNQSPLFTRNRIRMALNDLSSTAFKSELQGMISACRITRTYIDQVCYSLMSRALFVKDHGYAVIDLMNFCPSKIEDLCLSKFLSVVIQFISQRQKQIRGAALKLLMDYIRTFPCKNSLTAAGCYLCPDPGSRGSRVLVCCSVDCNAPIKLEFFKSCSYGETEHGVADELVKIIEDEKSYANHVVPDASDVHFLDVNPEFVLIEAKRLNIISESTYRSILTLQKEETDRFRSKSDAISNSALNYEAESFSTSGKSLQRGQFCYFMDRFILTWKLVNKFDGDSLSDSVNNGMDSAGETGKFCSSSCVIGSNMVLEVRHMVESDWLYLAELSRYPHCKNLPPTQITKKTDPCLQDASASAKRALPLLKCIPVAARRSLPVLVNQQGELASIPFVNFRHCPCLMVHVEFKPKIPLGGGHSSFI